MIVNVAHTLNKRTRERGKQEKSKETRHDNKNQCSILLAETARRMLFSLLYAFLLVPRTQRSVVLKRAKLRRQRSQPETTDRWSDCLSQIFSASRRRTIWHWGPIAPEVVNTRGLKSPCSTDTILSRYSRDLDFSALSSRLEIGMLQLLRARGDTILTSKNACRILLQNQDTLCRFVHFHLCY